MKYDAIVIGGGIAGLSSAAYLAKAGKKVAVFEQHKKPGGYYTSFTRKGIIFDISAHWTAFPDKINEMLEELNVKPIEFALHEPVGHYMGPDEESDIILTNDKEKFENSILKNYPDVNLKSLNKLVKESLAIENELMQAPSKSPELMSIFSKVLMGILIPFKLKKVLKYSKMPAEKFLESLFPGDELKGLRVALFSIAPIEGISAIGMLAFIGFALKGRAYAPVGGAQKVADAFEEAVIKNGGKIYYSKTVERIKIENKKVKGVILEDGSEFYAENVLSTVDAKATYYKLLDPEIVPQKFKKKLDTTSVSGTFFIVSIVTDIDPSIYGFDGTDVFINSSLDIKKAMMPNNPENSSFHINFPKYRDEGADPNVYGIQIVFPATFDFENYWKSGIELQRGNEYQEFKKIFASELIKKLENYIPDLSQHILYLDIATPITMYRYTHNYHGAAVGWSYIDLKQWKQEIPFIQGLYHAGHWVGPSGIPSVIYSGKNAARLILKNE
ncbi:phytoene desaturase family protein [Methanobacterium oryzae]|uniref:phytoene desaturase family protein n=1 Tax=Methanobacterium oryzae TaxID=69540 RepID=UPI003D20B553